MFAEEFVDRPVERLAGGDAIVDRLAGATAKGGGGGVAGCAERRGVCCHWRSDGCVVFEEERRAEVLWHV